MTFEKQEIKSNRSTPPLIKNQKTPLIKPEVPLPTKAKRLNNISKFIENQRDSTVFDPAKIASIKLRAQ
jgi:hypothetical protein